MLAAMDRLIMNACKGAGLDTFDALFHAGGEPVPCQVMRDTLELTNEYGVTVVESGAVVHYLASDIAAVQLGNYFEFDGLRYVIENIVPTQDSHWRTVHCRVQAIPEPTPEPEGEPNG